VKASEGMPWVGKVERDYMKGLVDVGDKGGRPVSEQSHAAEQKYALPPQVRAAAPSPSWSARSAKSSLAVEL
jgi:hypothetical protein